MLLEALLLKKVTQETLAVAQKVSGDQEVFRFLVA
jgi:hypothetical protein